MPVARKFVRGSQDWDTVFRGGGSGDAGVIDNFTIDGVRVGRIVSDDIPEVKEAVGIDPGEFDGKGSRSAALYFTIYPDAHLAVCSAEQNFHMAHGSFFKICRYRHQATADAEIAEFLDFEKNIVDRYLGVNLEGNAGELSSVVRHI